MYSSSRAAFSSGVFVLVFVIRVRPTLGFEQGLFLVVDRPVQLLHGFGQLLGDEHAARRALLADDVEQAVGMLGQHDHFPGRVRCQLDQHDDSFPHAGGCENLGEIELRCRRAKLFWLTSFYTARPILLAGGSCLLIRHKFSRYFVDARHRHDYTSSLLNNH
jgi:hypothetical protein